ncbi:MAG: hypothetical protein IJ939_03315, partial [Clostridia bacterium]|nr:hypothetical protein [Clostridia bacterium]
MYKFSTAKRTPSFDDYFKKKSNRKTKVTLEGIDDEIAAMTKTAALNTPKPEALPTTGSAIKSGIQSVLSKKYGEIDTKHLFDDISDKDIEDNLETAENTIQTNIDRGMLSKNALPKLPNLRDGLALSYAAANKGNSKAATRAREAAYTESAESLVDKVKNGLSYELPKMEKAVLKTNEKPKVTNLLGDPNTKPEIEDFLMKTSLSDENKEQNSDNPLLNTDVSWKSKALGDSGKADGAKTPIYSGDIWDNEQQEDLTGNDISHKDLYGFFTPSDNKYIAELQKGIVPFIKDLRINAKDLLVPENVHIQTFRSLGN